MCDAIYELSLTLIFFYSYSAFFSPEILKVAPFGTSQDSRIFLKKGTRRSIIINRIQESNDNIRVCIVQILNLHIITLCAHLHHFFLVSIHSLQYIHCLLQLCVARYLIGINQGLVSVFNYLPRCTYHLFYMHKILSYELKTY